MACDAVCTSKGPKAATAAIERFIGCTLMVRAVNFSAIYVRNATQSDSTLATLLAATRALARLPDPGGGPSYAFLLAEAVEAAARPRPGNCPTPAQVRRGD